MKRLTILLALFLASYYCLAQKDLHKISISELPEAISISNISTAVRWTDSLGDNIMIVTKPVVENLSSNKIFHDYKNGREEHYSAPQKISPERAYHYLIQNDSASLTWETIGIVSRCEEGMNSSRNWFVITDLDNNAKAETWLIYRSNCATDAGVMKIIMVESKAQFSAYGNIQGESFNEDYFDGNFRVLPDVFRNYAARLWKNFALKN